MFNWFKPVQPKTLGQIGEEIAQIEYKHRGYSVIAANFFNRKGKRLGEVDFIAAGSGRVIFVEVKTRSTEADFHGTAAESVDRYKQAKLLKAIKIFLLKEPEYRMLQPQIDVAVIILNDMGQLEPVKVEGQRKYVVKGSLDKLDKSVTIIPNAVEDWD